MKTHPTVYLLKYKETNENSENQAKNQEICKDIGWVSDSSGKQSFGQGIVFKKLQKDNNNSNNTRSIPYTNWGQTLKISILRIMALLNLPEYLSIQWYQK